MRPARNFQRLWACLGAAALVAAGLAGTIGSASAAPPGGPKPPPPPPGGPVPPAPGCHLGRGVQHVVEIVFDNVHFNRDNPNVPSDLEMIPSLEHFIEDNGTMLSNNHTPLIAHTADDIITTETGLYGDRAGMPISNSFQAYNTDGTTDPGDSFTYWTDPIDDTAATPNAGHDTNPSLVYSPVPPATSSTPIAPTTETPAPWVPWTRAGCDVGAVATANMELETPTFDIPKVFGAGSPEAEQVAADSDSFKDAETADYIGVAVHCAQHSHLCAGATAVKYGQSSPSPTAVSDLLPDEPGGYTGYQALFGHRYVAPVLGAGTPNVTRNGYGVTNAAGNLVDENGNEIDGAFLTDHPGFPGFSDINASQTLAYLADMQESGVPVTYGYISDIHGNEHIPSLSASGDACYHAPAALGSGSPCYVAQAQYYNQAFATFFQRLAADGMTPRNTLFVFSADEGDHEAGANVGRSVQPTPATCDGATVSGDTVTPDVPCTYPAGSFGELSANLSGLLATEKSDTTPYSIEADTAPELYVTGQPGEFTSEVRTLEHDVAGLTATNPYAGGSQPITNYLADPTEEAIVHMVNADPARTPTLALFAKPDYYFSNGGTSCGSGGCVTQTTGFAWDHGDYAAEINNNWLGIVGPGVANLGLDGSGPASGPSSAGPSSGQETSVQNPNTGTWIDESDIQPTLVYLAGLSDDYIPDGRVITEILSHPDPQLGAPEVTQLGACYKQLNSSVGEFGAATLIADTNGIEGSDTTYPAIVGALQALEVVRDYLANEIKTQLDQVEFAHMPIPPGAASAETQSCQLLINAATLLSNATTAATAHAVTAHLVASFGRTGALRARLRHLEAATRR